MKSKILLLAELWLHFNSIVNSQANGDISKFGNLIEGDIMIDHTEDPWERNAMVDMKQKRWSNGSVPFDLNETAYSEWDQHVIETAMKEIEENSCITFKRRTKEADYIYITPLGGCWSYLGRRGSMQTLSLLVPDCMSVGTVIHEFMHSLGFWHEHSRADRDHFILVLWENVIEEKEMNFAKNNPFHQNIEFDYDYFSVMHYNAYAFAKAPHLPTLKPKMPKIRLRDLGKAKTIGTLTDTDSMKLKAFYEC